MICQFHARYEGRDYGYPNPLGNLRGEDVDPSSMMMMNVITPYRKALQLYSLKLQSSSSDSHDHKQKLKWTASPRYNESTTDLAAVTQNDARRKSGTAITATPQYKPNRVRASAPFDLRLVGEVESGPHRRRKIVCDKIIKDDSFRSCA